MSFSAQDVTHFLLGYIAVVVTVILAKLSQQR